MRPLPLLAAFALLGAATTVIPAADATIRICALPVDVKCFDMDHRQWCTVYVRLPGSSGGCIENMLK